MTLRDDRVAGDALTLGAGSTAFSNRNAGANVAVAVSGLVLSGADAANYQLSTTTLNSTATINRAVLTPTLAVADKTYDGSTSASITLRDNRVAGDALTLGAGSAAFANRNAGANVAVAVSGLALSGADATNYQLSTTALNATATINRAALTPTFVAADKTYDGSTGASITLRDNRVAGDALTLSAGSAVFANRNAGANVAVAVSGLAASGADAANYQLSTTTLNATATINRAALALTANARTKVYGDTLNLSGNEFSALGLVAGETLGQVTLASNGALAAAPVVGSPYALTISNASGGTFNPINYDISYRNGQLQVTQRPLTVATNSIVRFADQANPGSFGFSTSAGGLAGSDRIASVVQLVPAGSATALGGSVFELLPSGAVFAVGDASNYSLRYSSGLLVVLPTPPRIGDADAGSGNVNFAILLSPDEEPRALAELDRARSATSAVNAGSRDGAPNVPALRSVAVATPEQISVMLSADGRRLSLPELLKMPLISFDPQLRRLMLASDTVPTSATTP